MRELRLTEVLRYMGQHGDDPQITQTARNAIDTLNRIAIPRSFWVCLPTESLRFLSGKDIYRHLHGCPETYVLCATLGAAVDREIRRVERRSMLDALALDAAAGEGIEAVCDAAEEEIRAKEAARGRFVTGRFSPGYGDFPITVQPQVLAVCDAARRIGLSVTENNILVPRKSVTALLGVSDVPTEGRKKGCGTCSLAKTCEFRKKGTTCGA
ncbi:MAG: methionine synthase [Butyricicoccaceae bacterium]